MPASDLISTEALRAAHLSEQLPDLVASVRVLVIGDVMLDRYWFGDVRRISPEAPVPIVQVMHSDDRPGGAANVARNVAALGARVTVAGVVGDDEAAQCLRRLLERDSITPQLKIIAGSPTTVKLRVLSRRQQMLRVDFDPPKTGGYSLLDTDHLRSLMRNHDVLVLSDYAKGCLDDPQQWICAAREHGLPVLVDPKEKDFSRYAGATVLKPNAAEFARAIGVPADDAALVAHAQAMRDALSVESLLVTRSEHGLSLFMESGMHHFPAQVREVFDVCGAGDTVIAVMAALLAAGVETSLSAWIANCAAGMAVGRTGTAAITMNELCSSLRQH